MAKPQLKGLLTWLTKLRSASRIGTVNAATVSRGNGYEMRGMDIYKDAL